MQTVRNRATGPARIFRWVIGLSLALVLMGVAPLAQGVTGVIHGRVTDPSGAAVPGVSVTAVEQSTGLTRTTLSGDTGNYRFDAVPSGVYNISAEMPGFKRFEQLGVQVSVAQVVRVDINLQLGEISESVTVTGAGLMVDTRTSEISALVDDERITELPLSGRNVIEFSKLLPGVSTVSAPQVQIGTRSGPQLSVHGGRSNQNYFTLNGVYFNNPSRNTGLNPPPPDAVQEFRIKTNNYGAAEGRNSGAVVRVVTRRGTNDFHGSVWEFHRNDNLNARSFFEAEKRERLQNQFGAAAGGPIVKDKIFIFGAYEGFRDRPQAGETGMFPPTPAERSGDFSDRTQQLVNPFTGEPFPNNMIDPSLFDPIAARLLQVVPQPNTPSGRYVVSVPNPNNNDLFMIRNDWLLSETHNLFWHFYWNRNERPTRLAGNVPEWGSFSTEAKIYNFGVNHIWTISPNVVNEASFGFTRTEEANSALESRSFQSIGIDLPEYHVVGSPIFDVAGRFNMGSTDGFTNDSDGYSVSESVSWIKGDHTMKFGGEFFRLTFFQGWLPPTSFSFRGQRSGDQLLDFLLGAYYSASINYGQHRNDAIQPWYWSFYFQDEWQVHPRLTLTFGLRYELPSPWEDRREIALSTVAFPLDSSNVTRAPVQDPPPGYLFANYDLPAGLVEADKNNFAPRVGFAWDMFGNGKTAIRGGAGIFYDTANADSIAQENPPMSGLATFYLGRLSAPHAGVTGSLPPPDLDIDPTQGTFTYPVSGLFVDLGLRTPYVYHWNLGVSQQINRDLALSVDYVGKIGRKLLAYYPWNPAEYIPGESTLENAAERVLYPPYAPYSLMLASMYDSWYHGMDVQVNRRLVDRFSILASYTLSKAIDQDSTSTLGGYASNPFDVKKSQQGLATFDRRHVLSVSALWTPIGLGAFGNPFLDAVASGWRFTAIFRASTGSPLEFVNCVDQALDGTGSDCYQHPVVLRNPELDHASRADMISEYFDTDAFVLPEIGTYGNAGRGLMTGPGSWTFDLGILKEFGLGITEESRVQFRAEFFNLFNNPNFGNPNTQLTSSRFGQITSAGSGREGQLALKILW